MNVNFSQQLQAQLVARAMNFFKGQEVSTEASGDARERKRQLQVDLLKKSEANRDNKTQQSEKGRLA